MVENMPAGVTNEDWDRVPDTVRAVVAQTLSRLEQIEAQMGDVQERLEHSVNPSSATSTRPDLNVSKTPYILVVDDNEMNRDLLTRRLQRQGYQVEVAVNGREALELISTHDFDLILLDIMMPEMNGYQVLEYLQADKKLRHLPVIVITAVDELESVVRCIKMGAEDYLSKPFNPVLLKARISASLEKKRLRDQREAYLWQLNIENQRKSNELERARQIQLSLLPTEPPDLPYLDIAARQETASEVGGDYYDFLPLSDNRLRVAVGDATGHGVASGLMVSMTKASLLATNETELTTLVHKINSILNKIELDQHLNMALLLLEIVREADSGIKVQVIGGGTPPLYIWRANGGFEEIMLTGLPLGIVEEVVYTQTELDFTSGDVVLLMSDGLPEMFNRDRELLGYDRLVEALGQLDVNGLTANQVLEQVAHIGYSWSQGHPLDDDVTLVVMRVK